MEPIVSFCDDLHSPKIVLNCNNIVGRGKESIRSVVLNLYP